MRRGRSPVSRHSGRTSPDRSMSSGSRAKMRRSQSPTPRTTSAKPGQISFDKRRSPVRTLDSRSGTRSNRSPVRSSKTSRPSLSPRRHSTRSSLSPHRQGSGPTKRRSSVSPRRGGGAPPVKRSAGPVTGPGRPQQHQRSPPSSSIHHAAAARKTAGSGPRRSFTPPATQRRTDGNAGHSSSTNVRSQIRGSGRGRSRGGVLGSAPVRPITGNMKEQQSHPTTRSSPPRWHPNNAEERGRDPLLNNSNVGFKEKHVVDDRPRQIDTRVEQGEMMSNRGRPRGFGAQRNGGPPFGERQMDDRMQSRPLSPFNRRDGFINEDGNYGGGAHNFPNLRQDGVGPRGLDLPARAEPPQGGQLRPQDEFMPPPRVVVPDDLELEPDDHSPGGMIYTQEELKKITVDIFRNVPHDPVQSRRNFFNPEDVVVVRRPGEGINPIFDRDEIRQAAKAEALFMERRVVALAPERHHLSPQHSNQIAEFSGVDSRENFRISSAPFDLPEQRLEKDMGMGNQHHQSLNDRWQKTEMRNQLDGRNQNQFNRNDHCANNMDGPGFGLGGGQNSFQHDNQYPGGGGGKRSRSHSPESRQYFANRFGGGDNNHAARRGMVEPPGSHRGEMFGGGGNEPLAGQGLSGRNFIQEQHQRFDPPPGVMMTQQELQQRRPMIDQHDLRHSLSKRRQSLDSRPQGRGDYSGQGGGGGRENDDRERDFGRDDKGGGRRSSRERGQPNRWAPDTTSDSRNRGNVGGGQGGNWNQDQQQDERGGQRGPFNSGGGGGGDGGHLPNFSTRPDKYSYQEWRDKPDVVPKGSSYFEHDTRDDFQGRVFRGRGGFVSRGDRGGRGRGAFNNPRGGGNFSGHRGGSGGGSGAPSGGGESGRGDGGNFIRTRGGRGFGNNFSFNPRNKWSPSQWQHDKFETSPERKMDQDNKLSSTTGNK